MKIYKKVALCGYRQRGKDWYLKLSSLGFEIPYIIERNYEALSRLPENEGLYIVGFGEKKSFYESADVILLTGDLPEELMKEALELAGIEVEIVTDIEV